MGKLRHRLPGHGTIAAYLALFVALSTGGAYAADQIGSKDIANKAVKSKHVRQNAVLSKHIKNEGIKTKDLRDDAVNARKVADGSLLSVDFADGELPAGPQGPKGGKGDAGPGGPRGGEGEPGSAFAYARIKADGTIDPDGSKNITQDNVEQQDVSDAGLVCFTDLPTLPRSAVVAAQSSFDGGQADVLATVNVRKPGFTLGVLGCSGNVDATVSTYDISETGLRFRPFYVWFED